MGGVAETSPYWIPLLMGGLSAAGGALSGGAEGKIGGYGRANQPPKYTDIHGTLLGDQQNRLDQQARISGARANMPISLAGTGVQPIRRLGGGILPFDLGPTAIDPALTRPELISRESAFAPPPMPQFGQGRQELMSALELLGVTQDSTGNLTSGGQGMFTGARGGDADLGSQFGLGDYEKPELPWSDTPGPGEEYADLDLGLGGELDLGGEQPRPYSRRGPPRTGGYPPVPGPRG